MGKFGNCVAFLFSKNKACSNNNTRTDNLDYLFLRNK